MPKQTHFLPRAGKDKHTDSGFYEFSQRAVSDIPPDISSEMAAELAINLRNLRRAKQLTQNDIAVISGLHHQNVSRFERGAGATLNTVLRYTAALGGTLVFAAASSSVAAEEAGENDSDRAE